METFDQLLIKPEMNALRQGIKDKYKQYHLSDQSRFPALEFNTNRANYRPLRESFEEEFYVERGIDRTSSTIHIPSTNTLVLLFTDDNYVPSQKIWNTCWSYAEGRTKAPIISTEATRMPPQPTAIPKDKWIRSSGIGFLIGLLIGVGISQYELVSAFRQSELAPAPTTQTITVSHDLVIDRPTTKSKVPPQFLVAGQAKPGDVVWPVVRAQGTNYYYVQFPVLVTDKGYWLTAIEIYGAGFEKAGKTHQLRAFINPIDALKTSDVLSAWPEAERSTSIVEIVMDGSKVVL